MINVITIEPCANGWAVLQDGVANPQVFTSGARAEEAALRLARRLADAGRSSEVVVYLRDGALGGRFVCPAVAPEA
jgi:acetylornithine/succinyldiaminopimelate/putrescine aminotransferase